MNTLDRLDSINNGCRAEIEEADKIYCQQLQDADTRKRKAWLRFIKAKTEAVAKRDKLIAELPEEIDALPTHQ